MAKPKSSKTGKPMGRPPKPPEERADLPPITGLRIPLPLRDRLDALVVARNAELAGEGLSTNRNALVVKLLREAVEAEERRLGIAKGAS